MHVNTPTLPRRRAWPLAVLLALIAGCQAPAPPPQASNTAPAGEADTLLASAVSLYARSRDPQQALPHIERAARATPRRPDLLWLHAHFCAQSPNCDPAPIESQWRKLDPDNGAVWLGALTRAQRARDTAAEGEILEALSRSPRIDLYWNTLVWRIASATRDIAAARPDALEDPLTEAMNYTVEQLSLVVANALKAVVGACSLNRVQRAPTSTRCANVAKVLQNSDTFIAAGVGLGIEERMTQPGTAAAQSVAERIRTARYQQETAGALIEIQKDRAAMSRELIKLMQALRREQEVYNAVLRWAGEPTTPPAQWQPATG